MGCRKQIAALIVAMIIVAAFADSGVQLRALVFNLDAAGGGVGHSVAAAVTAANTTTPALVIAQSLPVDLASYSPWLGSLVGPDLVPLHPAAGTAPPGTLPNPMFHDLPSPASPPPLPAIAALAANSLPLFGAISTCAFSPDELTGFELSPPITFSQLHAFCHRAVVLGRRCLGPAGNAPIPSLWFDHLALAMHGATYTHAFSLGFNVSFTSPEVNATVHLLRSFASAGYFGPSDQSPLLACGYDAAASGRNASIAFPHYNMPITWGAQASSSASDPLDVGVLGFAHFLAVPINAPFPALSRDLLGALDVARSSVAASGSAFPLWVGGRALATTPEAMLGYDLTSHATRLLDWSYITFSPPSFRSAWLSALEMFMDPAANVSLAQELQRLEAARLQHRLRLTLEPQAHPSPGHYKTAIAVQLTTLTANAVIYFTLDGSPPTAGAAQYSGPIVLASSGDVVVKAMAAGDGLSPSPVRTFVYGLDIADDGDSGMSSALLLAIIVPLVLYLTAIALVIRYLLSRSKSARVGASELRLSADADVAISQDELRVGTVVGVGAFGTVYRALWRGTEVAVKRAHRAFSKRQDVADFIEEARMLMSLRHRNIVMFMGIVLDPPSIVTEFLDRGSLYDVIHDGSIFLDASIVFQWAHNMAQGLEFLTLAGVVHADFKSLNVMFDASWVPKIVDFGMSSLRSDIEVKQVEAADASLPAEAQNLGSLFWAAPEILDRGPDALSVASDAYALAITLFELAARSDPYPNENPMAVALQVRTGRRPNIMLVPGELDSLASIITRMWHADPHQRLSLGEAARMLESLYEPSEVIYPSMQSIPTGTVVVIAVTFSNIEAALSDALVHTAHALKLFHSSIRETALEAGGTVVDWGLATVTVALHRPAQAVLALESLTQLDSALGSSKIGVVAVYGGVSKSRGDGGLATLVGSAMEALDELCRLTAVESEPGFHIQGELVSAFPGGPSDIDLDFIPISFEERRARYVADAAADDHCDRSAAPGKADLYSRSRIAEKGNSSLLDSLLALTAKGQSIKAEPDRVGSTFLISRDAIQDLIDESGEKMTGSYATLYPAELDGMGKVLIKVSLRQTYTPEDLVAYVSAMKRSAALVAGSPLLAAPISVCATPPLVSCVVPYLPLGSLEVLLVKAFRAASSGVDVDMPLTPATTLTIARSLVAALEVLHRDRGQYHGALRPTNVLLRGSDVADISGVVLCDFGLNAIKHNMATMTLAPSVAYMAPESLRGEPDAMESDIFVMGTLLFELTAHMQAFSGSNAVEVGFRIMRCQLPPLEHVRSRLLRDVITRCWMAEPSQRPNITSLKRALDAATQADFPGR